MTAARRASVPPGKFSETTAGELENIRACFQNAKFCHLVFPVAELSAPSRPEEGKPARRLCPPPVQRSDGAARLKITAFHAATFLKRAQAAITSSTTGSSSFSPQSGSVTTASHSA